MKKRPLKPLKIALAAFILSAAIIRPSGFVNAESVLDQPSTAILATHNGITSNPGVNIQYGYSGGGLVPSNFKITSIATYMGISGCGTTNLHIKILDDVTTAYENTLSESCYGTTTPALYEFTFPEITITSTKLNVIINQVCGGGGCPITIEGTNTPPFSNNNDGKNAAAANFSPAADYPAIFFNGAPIQTNTASATNPIVWQNPPMTQNFSSPDFNYWQNCVYFNTGSGKGGYYIAVAYGTSTLDSFFDITSSGTSTTTIATSTIPFYSLPVDECVPTFKHTDLPPGNYVAQAGLYRTHLLFPDIDFMGSTTVLNFTVVGGDKVSFVGQENISGEICKPTDFQIFSFDYGQGLCKVAVSLFYPPKSAFDNFSNLWTTIKVKPPFGYFTISATQLNGMATSTAPSVTLPSMGLLGGFKSTVDGALALLVSGSFLYFLIHRQRKWDFH